MFKEKIRVLLLGGSLTDHGSYADGNYQGYPVVITTESTVYHVRINAVSTGSGQRTAGTVSGIPEAKCQTPGRLFLYFYFRLTDHKNAGSKRKQSSGYDQQCRRSSDSVSSWR